MSVHACQESLDPRRAGLCACGQRLEATEDPRTAFDPVFQREFLRAAERQAGLDIGWCERVSDRVAAMHHKYGDRFRSQGISRLLTEIDEEALDIGGWPSLAAMVANGLDLDEDAALAAKLLLQEIAAHGVRVSNLVEQLRELLSA